VEHADAVQSVERETPASRIDNCGDFDGSTVSEKHLTGVPGSDMTTTLPLLKASTRTTTASRCLGIEDKRAAVESLHSKGNSSSDSNSSSSSSSRKPQINLISKNQSKPCKHFKMWWKTPSYTIFFSFFFIFLFFYYLITDFVLS